MMVAQVLDAAAILLIVAVGALIAERAGVLNIALEGMITVGAFTMAAMARTIAGPTASFLAAIGVGALAALVFVLFALYLRANPFVVGLAINLLALGIVSMLSKALFGTGGTLRFEAIRPWWAQPIAIALVVAVLAHLFLYHSVGGIRLRAAGEEPIVLQLQGITPRLWQGIGLVASGVCAAAAGALMVIRLHAYLPNISSGRGWIALVVLYLGYRRVWSVVVAALFFGTVDALSMRAQAVVNISPTLLLALPYVLTVIAFAAYSGLNSSNRQQRRQG